MRCTSWPLTHLRAACMLQTVWLLWGVGRWRAVRGTGGLHRRCVRDDRPDSWAVLCRRNPARSFLRLACARCWQQQSHVCCYHGQSAVVWPPLLGRHDMGEIKLPALARWQWLQCWASSVVNHCTLEDAHWTYASITHQCKLKGQQAHCAMHWSKAGVRYGSTNRANSAFHPSGSLNE